MKSRYWEKIWHEIIDDPKLGPLPDSVKWRFVTLVIAAGRFGQDGLLPDLPDLAWELRIAEEQLRAELPMLARRELVELRQTPTGERWFLPGYAKRQSAMSDSERQQRRRSASSASASSSQRKKKEVEAEAEADNVTVFVTVRDNNVTAELLKEHGIARNRTTAPLWNLDPEYVAAHLATADTPGLAIRRMLDHDPAPTHWSGRSYLELEDVIRR